LSFTWLRLAAYEKITIKKEALAPLTSITFAASIKINSEGWMIPRLECAPGNSLPGASAENIAGKYMNPQMSTVVKESIIPAVSARWPAISIEADRLPSNGRLISVYV